MRVAFSRCSRACHIPPHPISLAAVDSFALRTHVQTHQEEKTQPSSFTNLLHKMEDRGMRGGRDMACLARRIQRALAKHQGLIRTTSLRLGLHTSHMSLGVLHAHPAKALVCVPTKQQHQQQEKQQRVAGIRGYQFFELLRHGRIVAGIARLHYQRPSGQALNTKYE